jgi:membrane protease YdiL (CAAX protease family)
MAAIALATAAVHHRLVGSRYARAGFSALGYALIVLAAPAIVVAIAVIARTLNHAFDLSVDELDGVRTHGLAPMLGLVVIAPPLFEELAFRGLIYGALAQTLRRSEAYLISSFAFALLHLSLPMLLTHLPLGLYLCWLRDRSGSLYPPMFAHFCHNLGVVIADLNGWV